MRNNLPEIDMEKLQIVLDTKERYLDGKLTLDEARAILRERVKTLRPYEIALAEQELKTFDEDECRKEDIQQMMELFQDVLDRSRPDLPEDHPIMCYLRENDEMRRLLKQVEELAQYPVIKNQWLELYDELHKFRLHLSRKQNQLYHVLGQEACDRSELLRTFVFNQLSKGHQARISSRSSLALFEVDGRYPLQIEEELAGRYRSDRYYVLEHGDLSREKTVPVWLFGFLY